MGSTAETLGDGSVTHSYFTQRVADVITNRSSVGIMSLTSVATHRSILLTAKLLNIIPPCPESVDSLAMDSNVKETGL